MSVRLMVVYISFLNVPLVPHVQPQCMLYWSVFGDIQAPNEQARWVPVGFCTSSPVSLLLPVPKRRQKEVHRASPRAKGSLALWHRHRGVRALRG